MQSRPAGRRRRRHGRRPPLRRAGGARAARPFRALLTGLLLGALGLLGGLALPAPAQGAPPHQAPLPPISQTQTPPAFPFPPPAATAAAAAAAGAGAGAGRAQAFPQTGFRLGDPATDAIAAYFDARGGVATFGYPVSRPFLLHGVRVQVFQRHVLQQLPGGVAPLNLLDGDYLPYTDFGTAVVPAVDPAVAGGAPAPGTPDYGDAVAAYVAGAVPDVWQGQTVGFRDAFLQAGRAADPAAPAGAQTLLALEVLGFPTSAPAPDPRTPLLVAQRFQRGVLQYDATTGLTEPLLLADAFKAVLTGRFLPASLAAQSRGSPYALQYRPGLPGWLARPEALPGEALHRRRSGRPAGRPPRRGTCRAGSPRPAG